MNINNGTATDLTVLPVPITIKLNYQHAAVYPGFQRFTNLSASR